MNLHAYICGDVVKPAGEFTDDKGRKVKYDEKRILTVLEINGQEAVKHQMEMRIPVADSVAGKDTVLVGQMADFVITELRAPRNNNGEFEIVGRLAKLTGVIAEKSYGEAKPAPAPQKPL